MCSNKVHFGVNSRSRPMNRRSHNLQHGTLSCGQTRLAWNVCRWKWMHRTSRTALGCSSANVIQLRNAENNAPAIAVVGHGHSGEDADHHHYPLSCSFLRQEARGFCCWSRCGSRYCFSFAPECCSSVLSNLRGVLSQPTIR